MVYVQPKPKLHHKVQFILFKQLLLTVSFSFFYNIQFEYFSHISQINYKSYTY